MSKDQGTTTLPPELWDALASAYQAYKAANVDRSPDRDQKGAALAVLAASGRKAGWPVRALAEPCGVSPERLRQIIKERAPKRLPSGTPKFPPYKAVERKPRPKPKTKRSHLTKDEARELRDLAPDAKKNTGSRPLGSHFRKTSETFSRLVIKYHKRGVIWEEISDATRHWKQWPLPEGVASNIAEIRGHQRALQKARKTVSEKKSEINSLERGSAASKTAVRDAKKELTALSAEVERLADIAASAENADPLPPEHKVSGLRMRAARHGYGKGSPPSIQPYRRVVIHQQAKQVKSAAKSTAKESEQKTA